MGKEFIDQRTEFVCTLSSLGRYAYDLGFVGKGELISYLRGKSVCDLSLNQDSFLTDCAKRGVRVFVSGKSYDFTSGIDADDESFDVVLDCRTVVENCSSEDELASALREVWRITKRRGRIRTGRLNLGLTGDPISSVEKYKDILINLGYQWRFVFEPEILGRPPIGIEIIKLVRK